MATAALQQSTTLSPEVFTITHSLLKKPLHCHHYHSVQSSTSELLLFTHGAGGILSSAAVLDFCVGYSPHLPLLAFQGSPNLAARVKGFHACIEECGDKKTKWIRGGRSMGARAAVIAANESQLQEENKLILVSYPLKGAKGDIRDQILLDLPETSKVLFIIGDKDAMCPLDLLSETRSKMKAKSHLIMVRKADHGMNITPHEWTKEVGEMTGQMAAVWVKGELCQDNVYIGKNEQVQILTSSS
jgi:predicted alpha/beta-hydrolase family hydrolase